MAKDPAPPVPPVPAQPDATLRNQVATENHAQMIRFVWRKLVTSEEAAAIAVANADALIAALKKPT